MTENKLKNTHKYGDLDVDNITLEINNFHGSQFF